jgi:opacity protein-like surface antigen
MRTKTAVLWTFVPLLIAAATPAHAQNRAKSWELGPFVTSNHFDDDIEIEDQAGVGFRFGYNFTRMHELEFSFDGVDTEDSVIHAIDVTVGQFQVNYVLNLIFDRHQTVVPYVTAGLGSIRIEADDPFFGTEDETDDLFNLGGGVRFFFGNRFNLRLDARRIFFQGDNRVLLDDDYQNTQLSAGVGWVL